VALEITPLPHGSAELLSRMHGACFADEPWDAAALSRVLSLSGVFGYVASVAGDPAGFIVARSLGEEAEILTVGVLPGMRRQSVGRGLLASVIAETGRQRIASIVLAVAVDNEPARRLYAGAGFQQVGRRPRYYRRADFAADALILRRDAGREFPGKTGDAPK
jgi:ribosomal-protein-alanine N-acetyltransferase